MKDFMKVLTALMLMVVVVCTAGCTKKDNAEGEGTISGHTYVDLGLPSGTLWAACNVGATTPEEYGDYFAWGETKPKDTYNWETYKYCHCENKEYDSYTKYYLTKYCSNSEYGYNDFTDNLTILQSVDDAATANWGSRWHIPTKEQWQELLDYTTLTLTKRFGVSGCLCRASNGNIIFLPAAGDYEGNEHRGDIHYMSSSLKTNYPSCAWYLSTYQDGCFDMFYEGGRVVGQPVRAVCSSK